MKIRYFAPIALAAILSSGCASLDRAFCYPACHLQSRASSSLVGFLYPDGQMPPSTDSIPQLKVPLRVGLAFLPSQQGGVTEGLEASHRDELLERIRKRFSDRNFVSEIVIIPDYYLTNRAGFDGLAGVQRLYSVDVMALVSYDQVMYRDETAWSLGYLTIIGAYVLKGNSHDVTSLVDLAVVDPASRSIVLRAGGTDTQHATATLINDDRVSRTARAAGFVNATDAMIDHFDVALTQFESDVRSGKAHVRISQRTIDDGKTHSGAGACDPFLLLLVGGLLAARLRTPKRQRRQLPADASTSHS